MFQLNVFCLNKKISNVIAFVCKKNPINEKAIDPIFELLVRVLFNFTKTRVVDQFLEGQGYHHILKKKKKLLKLRPNHGESMLPNHRKNILFAPSSSGCGFGGLHCHFQFLLSNKQLPK